MKFATTLCLSAALLLSSCASAPIPPKQPPVNSISNTSSVVATRLPSATETYSATALKGTYFGVTGAKGSATIGVLFGVVGVLGNIAHINSENKDSAGPLSNLTSQNLGKLLADQLEPGNSANAANPTYELVPSANLYFKDKTTYWLTCTITAHQKTGSWQARYAVPFEGTFSSTAAADTERAINSLGPCLKSAYVLFTDHVSGKLGSFEAKTVTSPRMDGKGEANDKFLISTSALPERVIANDVLGLVQLRKDQIEALN